MRIQDMISSLQIDSRPIRPDTQATLCENHHRETSQDRIGHSVEESKDRQSAGELTQEELVDAFTSFEQNVQRRRVMVFPVVGFDSSV